MAVRRSRVPRWHRPRKEATPAGGKPPDEVKALAAALQTQQRSLLVGSVVLYLFLIAPDTNEVLRRGQQELAELSQVLQESLPAAVDQAAEKDDSVPALLASLANVEATAIRASTAPEALGYRKPETLGESVKLLEGKGARCAPEARPIAPALGHLAGGVPLRVRGIGFIAVHEESAVAAARVAFDAAAELASKIAAASKVEASARKALAAPAVAANENTTARAAAVVPPEPPRTRFEYENGRPVVVANPQWDRWKALKQRIDDARSTQGKAEAAAEAAKELATDATATAHGAFCRSLQSFQTSVLQQLDPVEKPRYVAARLELEDSVCFGDTTLYVPVACARAALLSDGALDELLGGTKRPLLAHLRGSSEWESLARIDPKTAGEVINERLIRSEGSVDVFGVSVHRRLIFGVAPAVLAAIVLFHLIYLRRFQRAVASADGSSVRAMLECSPDIPSRSNWALPLAVFLALTGSSAVLALQGAEAGELWWIAALVAPILGGIAFLVALSIRAKD